MKRTLLLISFCIMLMGCAAVSKWTSAQADCASDPLCLAEAQRYASVGQAVASPWGPIAVGASGSCILFVALGILGMKKKDQAPK
jgi:starvation-inducible outer membrane lipoprotein